MPARDRLTAYCQDVIECPLPSPVRPGWKYENEVFRLWLPNKKLPSITTTLPILPVRDTVLFPNAILPLTVGRESSLKLITDLKEEEKFIGVVSQRDPRVDNPQPVDLFQIGTVAFVHKIIKLPSQSLFIFVEGLQRIAIEEVTQMEPYLRARVKPLGGHLPEREGIGLRRPGAQRDHACSSRWCSSRPRSPTICRPWS